MARRRRGWSFTSSAEPAEAADALDRSASELSSRALHRLSETLAWYRDMPADLRAWVGVVVQNGISAFSAWYREPDRHRAVSAEVFGPAPENLARAISLEQVVQMARVALGAVEESLEEVVGPSAAPDVREGMLRYSREIAFAAATLYARAAEERGAWDARLEALVVDAVLRNEADDEVRSQASALRWPRRGGMAVVIGSTPMSVDPEIVVDDVRRAARSAGHSALVGVHGDRTVALLDSVDDEMRAARAVADALGDDPVVVGPVAATLHDAAASARDALAARRVVAAWPGAPRPVRAGDLLPERALGGDESARDILVRTVYGPLANDRGPLLETVESYLAVGCSIEGASRRLLVHPNTVRYRLRRAHELSGWSPSDPRGQFALRTALVLGRLTSSDADAPPASVVDIRQRRAT